MLRAGPKPGDTQGPQTPCWAQRTPHLQPHQFPLVPKLSPEAAQAGARLSWGCKPALEDEVFAFINPPLTSTVKFCRQKGPTPHPNRARWDTVAPSILSGGRQKHTCTNSSSGQANPKSSFLGLIYHSHLGCFDAVTVVWLAKSPGTPVEIGPPLLFSAALRKHLIGLIRKAKGLLGWFTGGEKEFSEEFIAGSAPDGND